MHKKYEEKIIPKRTSNKAHFKTHFFSWSLFISRWLHVRTGKLWLPATVVNIAFVPPILRVLYLNCVFFFWSIFLSLKLNKEEVEV